MAKVFSEILQGVLQPVLQKKPHMRLMMDWEGIVGQDIARHTWPEKMLPSSHGMCLYVRVRQAQWMKMWELTPILIERLNSYFGYACVGQIRFLHQNEPGASATSFKNS